MIRIRLGVEDLADTRFAISPLTEAACSLWALSDPGRYALHLPWIRAVEAALAPADRRLLLALVGPTFALPDFLTPRPRSFAPDVAEELALVAATPPEIVRRDLVATYAPARLPHVLRAADPAALRDALVGVLRRYWGLALAPLWPRLRPLLEADTTHRARRLATGGVRLLFADMHPNVRWRDGALEVSDMIGEHDVDVGGRGLLLIPSAFAYKPVPPLVPEEAPWLVYPARGIATLWAPPPGADSAALGALVGPARARLLALLAEPLPTTELARRLGVTPSAVSQQLKVLHAAGLLARARSGRQVLYRRSDLGDRLTAAA